MFIHSNGTKYLKENFNHLLGVSQVIQYNTCIKLRVEGDLPTKILYTEFSPTVNFINRNFERRNLARSFDRKSPHRNFTRSFDRKSPHGNLPTVKKGIFPAGTLSLEE